MATTTSRPGSVVQGNYVRIWWRLQIDGRLTDPTTLVLRVRNPRTGMVNTYTYSTGQITRQSEGLYHKAIQGADAGLWLYSWEATGTGESVEQGEFVIIRSRF